MLYEFDFQIEICIEFRCVQGWFKMCFFLIYQFFLDVKNGCLLSGFFTRLMNWLWDT